MSPYEVLKQINIAEDSNLIPKDRAKKIISIIKNTLQRYEDISQDLQYSGYQMSNLYFEDILNLYVRSLIKSYKETYNNDKSKILGILDYLKVMSWSDANSEIYRLADIVGEDIAFDFYINIENLNKEFDNLHLSKSDIDLMVKYFKKAKNQKCLVEYLENRLKEVEDSNTSLSGVERGEYYGR